MSESRENLRKVAAGAACLAEREAVIAMEPETISKNGVSLKDQMSRGNFLRKIRFVLLAVASVSTISIMFSSCAVWSSNKLKGDFVGFSDNVTTSYYYTNKCIVKKMRKQSPPYNLLTNAGNEQMRVAVMDLKQGQNTSAYYALDKALDRIEYVQKKFMEKDPRSQYYVVMLTDGLDNNSGYLAKKENKGKYRNKTIKEIGDGYGDYLNARMNTIMKEYKFFNLIKKPGRNAFQSFVLLYKGEDIKKSGYSDSELIEILRPFTGAQNADRPQPELDEDIDKLIEKLSNQLVSRTFTFQIQKSYDGKVVRMVLNEKQQVFIEGEFVQEGKNYYFRNIKMSNGLTMNVSSRLIGSERGGAIQFNVSDIKLNGKPYKVEHKLVTQWISEYGRLVMNSEYRSSDSSRKNAYLIVILDGSNSFKEKFRDAQKGILRIVNLVNDL